MENKLKEFYKQLINDALNTQDMSKFYMLFVSLISADNNRSEDEIKTNCGYIIELIEVLSEYLDNKELDKSKNQLIQYNEKYNC